MPARLLSLGARVLLLVGLTQLGRAVLGGILDEAASWTGRIQSAKLILAASAPLAVCGAE